VKFRTRIKSLIRKEGENRMRDMGRKEERMKRSVGRRK
jgi:hypothetical protein